MDQSRDQASGPRVLFVTVADVSAPRGAAVHYAALPSRLVRGVVRPRPATRLGRSPEPTIGSAERGHEGPAARPDWCPGVSIFRGALVPVVDLAALLFGASDPEVRRTVVLELPGSPEPRRLALLVRGALGLGTLGPAHALPSLLSVAEAVIAASVDVSAPRAAASVSAPRAAASVSAPRAAASVSAPRAAASVSAARAAASVSAARAAASLELLTLALEPARLLTEADWAALDGLDAAAAAPAGGA